MQPTGAASRRLVSIQDAANHLGVTTKTIRRRISDGTLPAYRIGPRLLRVDLNEVDNALTPVPTTTLDDEGAA